MTSHKFDQEEFLHQLCSRLVDRFPDIHYFVKLLTNFGATGYRDEPISEEELARALTLDIPPLQRVLTFSMWISRDLIRNIAGITNEELEGIKECVTTADGFYPAFQMTIEQWNTHTVIVDDRSGHRQTIYEHKPWKELGEFYIIWKHTLGDAINTPHIEGSIEVVLHDNDIKCWLRNGRFGQNWDGEAKGQNELIKIPLDDDRLEPFLRPDDPEDENDNDWFLRPKYKSEPWYKEYRYEGKVRQLAVKKTEMATGIVDESGRQMFKTEETNALKAMEMFWNLQIQDNIARAIGFDL
jgi:hypothetical protein